MSRPCSDFWALFLMCAEHSTKIPSTQKARVKNFVPKIQKDSFVHRCFSWRFLFFQSLIKMVPSPNLNCSQMSSVHISSHTSSSRFSTSDQVTSSIRSSQIYRFTKYDCWNPVWRLNLFLTCLRVHANQVRVPQQNPTLLLGGLRSGSERTSHRLKIDHLSSRIPKLVPEVEFNFRLEQGLLSQQTLPTDTNWCLRLIHKSGYCDADSIYHTCVPRIAASMNATFLKFTRNQAYASQACYVREAAMLQGIESAVEYMR